MSRDNGQESPKPRLAGRLAMARPTVNWNQAGSIGVRTQLRGPQSKPVSQVTGPVVASDTRSSSLVSEEGEISENEAVSVSRKNHAPQPVLGDVQHTEVADNESKSNDVNTIGDSDDLDSLYGDPKTDLDESTTRDRKAQTFTSADTNEKIHDSTKPAANPLADASGPKAISSAPNELSEEEGEVLVNIVEEESNALPSKSTEPLFKRLYIPHVSRTTKEQEIRALFNGFPVTLIEIKQVFGRPTNEAYVNVAGISEAERAVQLLNGRQVNGKALNIKFAPEEGSMKSAYSSVTASAKASPRSSRRGRRSSDTPSRSSRASSGSESGEVIDDGDSNNDSQSYASESEVESRNSDVYVIEIDSDSDDEDPMVRQYSDAGQPHKPNNAKRTDNGIEIIDLEDTTGTSGFDTKEHDGTANGPQTLAELTTAQLELQVRYFYIGREPETIPETDAVHCTVCSLAGHLAPWCPAQICSHCGSKGTHFAKHCPMVARCNRCRARHAMSECPHKLKPFNLELTCDLCNEQGHVETDCELNWRSSGPIWKTKLPPLTVIRTCYNCGDAGHLANNCRRRRPGHAMGSSMWSESGLPVPYPCLPTTVNQTTSQPANNPNSKAKMPNAKAKGNAAASTRPTGNAKPIAFSQPSSKLKTNGAANKAKGKGTPVPTMQIKGLASRPSLDSPTSYSSAPPVQSQFSQQRDRDPQYQRGPPSLPHQHQQQQQQQQYSPTYDRHDNHPREGEMFIRGRANGNDNRRPRSRSRSPPPPRSWYQAMPPRGANGGYVAQQPGQREYRDRDDPRFNGSGGGGSGWRGGR